MRLLLLHARAISFFQVDSRVAALGHQLLHVSLHRRHTQTNPEISDLGELRRIFYTRQQPHYANLANYGGY